jgi:probable rRNA maturation factor
MKSSSAAPRPVAIANHHPRLRLDRRAVTRVIHTLDAAFASSGRESRIENRKSKIRSVPAGELSLVFLTDAALAQLHADFLDDPSVTDVITFEGNPALGTAGEICVSADAALRQVSGLVAPALAGTQRIPAKAGATNSSRRRASRLPALGSQLSTISPSSAFSAELTLYLVHGWLHLAGYDDLVPVKKRAMRRAEARAMELLRRHGSLPRFTLRPAR